jgi:DNA-binding NarL/FixJ family response regulator
MPIRLVLADDHLIVLEGLKRLFEHYDDFHVLQCCRDGNEALEAVRAHRPDVLVLDLRMPKGSGIDVLRTMAEEKLACRVVVLAAVLGDEDTVEVLRLGAMGIFGKDAPPEALLQGVRRVHAGKRAIDSEMFAAAFARVVRRASARAEVVPTLTRREIQIIQGVVEGLRNQDIAAQLSISEGTVKVHLHNIYEKIEVDNRVGLVLYAQEKGIL